MNRNIPVQVAYDRTNKGVDIREPSTAFFLIDSTDRVNYNRSTYTGAAGDEATIASANFQITKPGQNLITGFFTRLAMTEIELTWNIFNISETLGNNTVNVIVLEVATGTRTTYTVTIPEGNYTVAKALDALAAEMSTDTGQAFSVVDSPIYTGKKAIEITGADFKFIFTTVAPVPLSPAPFVLSLSQSLGLRTFDFGATPAVGFFSLVYSATDPDLLAYQYIDITCSQFASQQKVKDATTSTFDSIDVVFRWVFANDDANPTTYDSYGYPILQGYLPFKSRRLLPFPKHIRWDPLIPIGNLDFQTYTDQEQILNFTGRVERFEFKIQMLLSEV
jgi:hypothetical protein